MTLEWRRTPTTAPPVDDPGEPRLVARIRDEIAQRGPITFARFMERALYEPDLGYYARSTDRTTPGGDFVTAPELHPLFGWTVARVVDEMWRGMARPNPFTIREFGAGSGALFRSLVDGLARSGSPLAQALRYEPVDQPEQLAAIRRLAVESDAAALVHDASTAPMTGVVLANEFLDALPVHRVAQRGGLLRELLVDWRDEGFAAREHDLSSDALEDWFERRGIVLADGQEAEVNLAMLAWMARMGTEVERGYVLVIDYGDRADRLYDAARRPTGTIRAFGGQHVSGNVLGGVGRRDITAHVDFDALEAAARDAGFTVLARRRAAEFLLAAGLDEAYAAARTEADQDWDSALKLRAAVRRLLDPGALGGYWVTVLARGVDDAPPPAALRDVRARRDARGPSAG